MVQFRKITEENFVQILDMKQAEGQSFVPPNAESLAQAWLYYENHDVYSFAVCSGETPVGFMQLYEELEKRRSARGGALEPPQWKKSLPWQGRAADMTA